MSKQWHIIIKTHGWTVIDFREKGPNRWVDKYKRKYKRFVSKTGSHMFEYREYSNEWRFSTEEHVVLDFITLYAGVSLQEIHLTPVHIDGEIMGYLRKNCPNIHTLGFALDDILHCPEAVYFPPKLKRLTLMCRQTIYPDLSEHIISCFNKCSILQNVSLFNFKLSLQEMEIISKLTCLRGIDFTLHDTSVEVLSSTIGPLTFLSCFKLSSSSPNYALDEFDDILLCIAHWTNLKSLTLSNIGYTSDTFQSMIPELFNLETLELQGESVTLSVVEAIGTHLKQIKCLDLSSSSAASKYSCDSLLSLYDHVKLEYLAVRQSYNERNEKVWVGRVYDLLDKLPNIKKAKMVGYGIHLYFKTETYPVIKSAEIEVVDETGPCTARDVKVEKKWKEDPSSVPEQYAGVAVCFSLFVCAVCVFACFKP